MAINADEELPFGAWSEGRGLDPRALAKLLKPYGVKSKSIRVGDGTPKGYALEDLQDAFARYLPEAQQAQQAEPPPPHKAGDVADVALTVDVAARQATGVGAGSVCGYPSHTQCWQPHPITGQLVCGICHPPPAELHAISGGAA